MEVNEDWIHKKLFVVLTVVILFLAMEWVTNLDGDYKVKRGFSTLSLSLSEFSLSKLVEEERVESWKAVIFRTMPPLTT